MNDYYEAITVHIDCERSALYVDSFPERSMIGDEWIEAYMRESLEQGDDFRLKALKIREGEVEVEVANGHALYRMVGHDAALMAWRLELSEVRRAVEPYHQWRSRIQTP